MKKICNIVVKIKRLKSGLILLQIFGTSLSGLNAQVLQNKETSFIVYKLCNPIGIENYTVADSSLSKIYSINYSFNDRGVKRNLFTNYKVDKNYEPKQLVSNGFATRWTRIDENIKVSIPTGKDIFPITKSLPSTVKQLLIRYWKKNKKPQIIYS